MLFSNLFQKKKKIYMLELLMVLFLLFIRLSQGGKLALFQKKNK